MSQNLNFILSLSIVFAAIIGVIRFREMDRSYYPFIYDIWLALFVEVLIYALIEMGAANVVSGIANIFSILDFSLFTLLFYRWSLFRRNVKLLYAFLSVFFVAWVLLTFILQDFRENNTYFRLIYSFALIFFGVGYFNRLVVMEKGNMLRNSKFLICIGIIIFYTFFTIVCATQLSFFGAVGSRAFRGNLQQISALSNVFVNLLYALAVLWIPRKKTFTTAY